MKSRKIHTQIEKYLQNPSKKIVFLWGPRQVGKSTILNALHEQFEGTYLNFDDLADQRLFVPEFAKIKSVIDLKTSNKDSRFVFIDEIQKGPDSTQAIKLLTGSSDYTVVATGSSELRAKTNQFDTLAGRYKEYSLFPLTIDEYAHFKNEGISFTDNPSPAEIELFSAYLEEVMIFGGYPKVSLVPEQEKVEELKNIAQQSVIKDIANIYNLKNADLVYDLLRLLAMQIGNLINITELANSLKTTKATIDNYLSILERNKVIFLLEPLKSNKRRGYLERRKVYFWDLGIRNALIEDFRPTSVRQDLGALFENFVVAGAFRQTIYQRSNQKLYFFREFGKAQSEIDLIIESTKGERRGFEIKYGGGSAKKFDGLGISEYAVLDKHTCFRFLV